MIVEVTYASVREQVLLEVDVPDEATIEQAIESSGILQQFPEISLDEYKVGVFGHAESLTTVLREKDRIEIYRPITCDPKEVRRQRAKQKK
jgi:putative ubiquitin-RnfH superfamily antitoxin RatB of RatAB toxin-antitoxin module